MDIKELSDKLGVEVSTIYKWTHQRRIPFVHVGKLVRFRETDVMRWLQESAVIPVMPLRRRKRKGRKPHKMPGTLSYVDTIVEFAKKEVLGENHVL
ncbi:MAG: helix-turn-helix domain-containing protein [Dissulfurispiraceae bacterium]